MDFYKHVERRVIIAINKTWIKHFSLLKVFDDHHLHAALARKSQPLISVTNHSSCLDDPILMGILPWKTLLNPYEMRWSLGAKEICFKNPVRSWFFSAGQVLPIVRGDGIYQPSMNKAIELLNDNRWVHVFPEARVNQSNELDRFKWGTARLIMEAKVKPLVLPFYHRGMEIMVPLTQDHPNPMTKVLVGFGKPIDFREYKFDPMLSDEEQRARIMQVLQKSVQDIKVEVDKHY
eukprot:jgi/Hompol1/2538/HPOL_002948-RA